MTKTSDNAKEKKSNVKYIYDDKQDLREILKKSFIVFIQKELSKK